MDQRILEHSNALFIFKLKELQKEHHQKRTAIAADANLRGISNSGINLGNLLKSEAAAIGERMRARLKSFEEAFEEAKFEPSPRDFDEIWHHIKDVYSQGVGTTHHNIKGRAMAMGLTETFAPNMEAAAAYGHDEVLAEYNVWRSRVGLAGAKQTVIKAGRMPRV